jgi:hypothetical protein
MGEGAAVPHSRKPTEHDSFESAQATADLFGVALEKSAAGEQQQAPGRKARSARRRHGNAEGRAW